MSIQPIWTVLAILALGFTPSSSFNCHTVKPCTIVGWASWSRCLCGQSTQIRYRDFCCNPGITTRAECVANCSLNVAWNQTRSCPTQCYNGVVSQNGNLCICNYGYTGKCCEVIKNVSSTIRTTPAQKVSTSNIRTTTTQKESNSPHWLVYIEIATLTGVSTAAALALGCCCYKIYLCSRSRDDQKISPDSKESGQKRRLPRPKPKPIAMP